MKNKRNISLTAGEMENLKSLMSFFSLKDKYKTKITSPGGNE